jgi:RNA polymerase sigma-70 factor (ECF subfamily)
MSEAVALEPHESARAAAEADFSAFFRRERPAVLALAYALSGSATAAEDLTQEAFLAVHRRWASVRTYAHPESWVRRAVVNLAASRIRRAIVEARSLLRLREQAAMVPPPQDAIDLWSVVRALPRRQAQVIALFYLEDRPVAEIATILGCAEGTVKASLHQARKTLARQFALPLEEEAQ